MSSEPGRSDEHVAQENGGPGSHDHAAELRAAAADQRNRAAGVASTRTSVAVLTDAMSRLALVRRDSALDRAPPLPDPVRWPNRYVAAQLPEPAHDGLTGAYLRAPGLRELRREIVRAERTKQPLTVAFVDVNRLDTAKSLHAQLVGDALLIVVAAALRTTLRAYDLIIRYGRDEFVSVMSGQTLEVAAQRIELLNARLSGSLDLSPITVGLAALNEADSAEALVARADRALELAG